MLANLTLLVAAYLIGSISFAVVASRLFKLPDPRSYGSGNPGATNVLRSGSKGAAIVTLIGDCLKGWFAVWLALRLGFTPGMAALAGLAAFFGHVFSIFLRGKGGKGVATALGVIAGIDLTLAGIVLLVWLVTAFTTRYSSLAALLAAAAGPLAALILLDDLTTIGVLFALAAMLFWRHAANIERLRNGTESRIGKKKAG